MLLAAVLPLLLAGYVLLAMIVGRVIRACRDSMPHGPLCDCEACDPDAGGRLR